MADPRERLHDDSDSHSNYSEVRRNVIIGFQMFCCMKE